MATNACLALPLVLLLLLPPLCSHPGRVCPASLQVVTQYGDHDVPHVLEACERMEAHLTAAGAPLCLPVLAT